MLSHVGFIFFNVNDELSGDYGVEMGYTCRCGSRCQWKTSPSPPS